jgi:arabinose-5-phosphate isomerase
VDAEACPNNLAPTNSTTAQLVMGDALAVCLMQLHISKQKISQNTIQGRLGKKLLLS